MSSFTGLATFTLDQLGTTGSPTTGQVIDWFKYNLGKLNGLIQTNYATSGDFTAPILDFAASGFYSQLYMCYYYQKQVNANLGAAAYDWSEVREGDSVVRRVSKNEQAKTYATLSKDCQNNLNFLAHQYRISQAVPQVLEAFYGDMVKYDRISVPTS